MIEVGLSKFVFLENDQFFLLKKALILEIKLKDHKISHDDEDHLTLQFKFSLWKFWNHLKNKS